MKKRVFAFLTALLIVTGCLGSIGYAGASGEAAAKQDRRPQENRRRPDPSLFLSVHYVHLRCGCVFRCLFFILSSPSGAVNFCCAPVRVVVG